MEDSVVDMESAAVHIVRKFTIPDPNRHTVVLDLRWCNFFARAHQNDDLAAQFSGGPTDPPHCGVRCRRFLLLLGLDVFHTFLHLAADEFFIFLKAREIPRCSVFVALAEFRRQDKYIMGRLSRNMSSV